VVRTLEQDVPDFWKFAQQTAEGDPAERDVFASAMVGRMRDGTPLAEIQPESIPGVSTTEATRNQFTFDNDPQGTGCPFGAHIRRANPRNADLPTPPARGLQKILQFFGLGDHTLESDAKAATRFHRILRRGREYGTPLSIEDAIHEKQDSGPRGIHFMCLAANISRQFEFLQGAWMMNSKFDSMTDESDPLLGNRQPVSAAVTNTFSRPQASGICQRVASLPPFITVKGGAYFFLPSISAIRYLASLTTTDDTSQSM
jgi:deferrochelatase/peroxidase EfeB